MTTSRNLSDQILRYKSLVAAERVLLGLAELLPPGPRQRADWLRISSNLAFRRFQLALVEYFAGEQKAGFNPQQPRVPAGNPDGGQWTIEGERSPDRVRLAASDKPQLGPAALAIIAHELADRLISAYRSENGLWDLFGRKDGTVTVTTFNGSDIFGSNSGSPTYTSIDRGAAEQLRDTLIAKYPDAMDAENVGRRPNDALFHAEVTVLLRAARGNGGTLAGRTIEVFGDRPLCPSCKRILPYIGLELGNPTVTFIDPSGARQTIRDGGWIK